MYVEIYHKYLKNYFHPYNYMVKQYKIDPCINAVSFYS